MFYTALHLQADNCVTRCVNELVARIEKEKEKKILTEQVQSRQSQPSVALHCGIPGAPRALFRQKKKKPGLHFHIQASH